jgi:hypothetical protein
MSAVHHTSIRYVRKPIAKAASIVASLKAMDLPAGVKYDLDRLLSEIDLIAERGRKSADYWRKEAMGTERRTRLTRAGATRAGTPAGVAAELAKEIERAVDLYAHPEVGDHGLQVSVRKAGAFAPRGWVFVGRYSPGVTAEQIAEDLAA